MNGLLKVALLLVGAYVGYEVLKAAAIKQMGFSLESIAPSQTGLTTTITANVRVSNPTAETNTLEAFSGTVTANGQYLGYVQPPGQVTILPNAETIVPVSIALSDISLVNTVLGLLQQGTAVIILAGTAIVNGLSFPVDLTYQINA